MSFTDPSTFIADIRHKDINIDEDFMMLASEKLRNLTGMLEIPEMNFFRPLNVITTAMVLLAEHRKGFKCVFQPTAMTENLIEPILTLACTDASIAMGPIFRSFPSVILTSGTISPIDLYPKILNFQPVTLKSIDI